MRLEWPWEIDALIDWDIVGMNHYHSEGGRRLFVAMTKDGCCIKAEGPETSEIWRSLAVQAEQLQGNKD